MILRHGFQLAKPVVSARLYATALGAYKFHLNGGVVGDQILSPGWMDFRQHVPYQVYDVTTQVKAGRNAIAAYLAPGWYTTPLMWFRQGYNYGNTPPALKAQLRLEYADGSVDWVATDESWKAGVSPILSAEIYDGETYDARQVQPGWDTATFSDANWSEAKIITPTEPEIVSQYFQPIREEKVMTAHREHFLRPISHGFSRQNISQMKYGSQYPTRGKSPRAGGLALTRHFPRCGRKPLNQPDFAASTKLGTANAHLNHDADV
jgi:alpha-L-rhamnosidase